MNFTDSFFESINKISKIEFEQEDIKTFFNSAKNMLENASKKIRIRDKFEPYRYAPTTTLSCFLESEKTKSQYNLLYDTYKNEIVFYSDIRNWENIRNINDSFWSELLEVTKDHNIQFKPDSGPFYDKEKTPEFNANYKSIIFNLMSVYITAMLEPVEQRKNISFGHLEIIWTPSRSIDEIVEELNIAFNVFYKFNYLLWKSEDIRKRNRINRQNREKILHHPL